MSDANTVIKQAALDWFQPDWRRAAGFGGYVLEKLTEAGFAVVTPGTSGEAR